MTKDQRIKQLNDQLELIYLEMPKTFYQQRMRDKAVFEISKELEILENPNSYIENIGFWEGHEIRF